MRRLDRKPHEHRLIRITIPIGGQQRTYELDAEERLKKEDRQRAQRRNRQRLMMVPALARRLEPRPPGDKAIDRDGDADPWPDDECEWHFEEWSI
jgi:hypothetical protein